MGAMGYLCRRILCNRIKMALRKPVTYFYLLLLLFYMTALPMSLRMTVEAMGADSAGGLVTVLTVLSLWTIPANLIAFSKRKGVVYRNCDVHFLFPAPVGAKQVLLYAHFKTLTVQVILNLFVIGYGWVIFHAEGWRLAAYFVFSIVAENLLESSVMLLLYGSERMGERQRGMVTKAAYGLAGVLVLMGILAYLRGGLRLQTVADYLHGGMVQAVPVIGWYIAVLHLLFLGPTAVNVAGTACYFLLTAAVLTAARKMKCSGGFYEDAMKFAEDYEEVLESRRQGNVKRLGKKEKFGKARIRWRGHGASALFYRQLLEYKKSRYFIFDINTIVAVLAGAALAYLYEKEGTFGGLEPYRVFVLPVVAAYMIFIFTGFGGKWAKELKSPYTYLLPDSPFRKLMAATLMQHVQALINGCIMTAPCALVMGLALPEALLCILFYILMSAGKLYSLAVAQIVTGSALGTTARQLVQMLLLSMAAGAGVMGAIMGMAVGDGLMALGIMDLFLGLFTMIYMVIATLNFYHIEA